jgi:hypothetical protein
MSELYAIPNTTSGVVNRQNPWDFDQSDLPEHDSKKEYREWEALSSTKGCLFSAVEAFIPTQRVTKENPPRRLHGVVVDYDQAMDAEEYKAFMSRVIDGDHPAAYVSRSFSGGAHLVFLFEKPMPVPDKKHLGRLLNRIKKELKLTALARGFDEACFKNLYTYYSLGHDWSKVSEQTIGENVLYHWCYETSKTDDYAGAALEIPMDEVATEMEKRFPGELPDMQNGQRCRYFWGDVQSVSTSSCIVRPEGITVFTDVADKPFYSWAEILGNDFVRKFQEDRIGGCIANYWFDGKDYIQDEEDGYRTLSKDSLQLALECRFSINRNRPRGGGPSEMNRAIYAIEEMKYVDGLLPFVYNNERIVEYRNKSYFNTASVRPLAPAEGEAGDWGNGFPLLADWMEIMFGEEQLRCELAWLGYAYRNALAGAPKKGHAHFLVGPPNCGKTLYNTTVLADLFGGHMKATEYFLGKIHFNNYLFDEGLWTIDDSAPASDKKNQDEFTSLIKEFVANDEFSINAKFKKPGRVKWLGRLALTLNDDPESIRLIPDLGMSISDKLMVFLCRPFNKFTQAFRGQIRAELPSFARWLCAQEVPEDMREVRFGVTAYLNETIKLMHQASGELETYIAILDWLRAKVCNADIPGREDYWEGTAGEIMRLAESEGARALTRSLSPTSLGIGLNKLYLQGAMGLDRVKTRSNRTLWKVSSLDDPASPSP